MGMFHLGKCPRCWDYPCHCETDAYGDSQIVFTPPVPLVLDRRREVELLQRQNELLTEIAEKLSKSEDD